MLTLSIRKRHFYQIRNGYKLEEYKQIKPYYVIRFQKCELLSEGCVPTNNLVPILFKAGQNKQKKTMVKNCLLTIGSGKREWGAKNRITYFVLHILNDKQIKQYHLLQASNALPQEPNEVLKKISNDAV